MRLGETPAQQRARATAKRRRVVRPPKRAAIVSDGVELEIVWYPHRDALSLLPPERSGSVGVECRVIGIGKEGRSPRWSFLG